jgi:hypothetical protein
MLADALAGAVGASDSIIVRHAPLVSTANKRGFLITCFPPLSSFP